ncbi:SDR family NAD(P)-dependent oxidoreductase [Sphingobium chungbukense]|uniref:Short-chain dehydrogenase n=1 Tax=Sphingobium chungbukense TaxID=56193 RepID=A0A0M3AJH6_9SPHN|nr:glucose 1-dehydrogenase [Sphingobium chungbukense]KKW90128.1 short-chain dehydrogenase [Sphingobium chungbukense]
MNRLLEDKIVLVTGAAAGIGRAIASLCAAEGAHVVCTDIDRQGLDALVAAVVQSGGTAECRLLDVSDAAAFLECVADIASMHGALHGAVNNAGIPGANAFIADYPDDVFQRVLDINVKGVFNGLKAQIPIMLRQGCGAIVNVASIGALVGKDGQSAYIASKHAVLGMTKSGALEYGRAGVRINAVCPGIIRTAMIEKIIANDRTPAEVWDKIQPIGRMGTPEEVAEAVIWLLSDRSSLVHGHGLVADGGYTVG